MVYRALSDVRVIDLTHYIAGPYATRLLAQFGADVIKVEPPCGEGGRRLGPHRAASAGDRLAERGGLFAFLNADKTGVALNLKDARGRELLMRLVADADLLYENFAPGTLTRLGLGPDDLIARFPRLSIVSISNYGQDGPDRDAPVNDIVLAGRGGWTFAVGEPKREPLSPPGSLAQYVGAVYAALGGIQALFARDLGLGHGQRVDVSLLETTVATMIYDTVAFQYTGMLRVRRGKQYATGPFLIATLRCRDGYAGLHCVSDRQFRALFEMMGRPELVHDERFASAPARMANNAALLELVEAFFAGHDAAWLYREGQRRGIPLVPIPTVAQVLEWEQLTARRYFETIDDPALGPIRIPGAPLRLGSHRAAPSRPAPRLGEHNRALLGGRLGLSEGELRRLREDGVLGGML
jgi:crotonobetainyl-CoA:carnitine CoA-transferase CaiB-like acyl-CoA transferase